MQSKPVPFRMWTEEFIAPPEPLSEDCLYLNHQFTHVPPDKPGFPNYGAFHTSEVPYALHTLHLWNRPWAAGDFELERIMSSYWANFARTGNPNGKGLPHWTAYDSKSGCVQEFRDRVASKPGLFRKELEFLGKQTSASK